MKSVVENVNPTRVRLSVETPFEELKSHLDEAYKEIAQQIVVPGFRKGKVPPRIIDQRVGRDAVLQEAVNHALPELYQAAVNEADVQPLGQPEVDVTDFADGTDLKFTAEVDIKPAFELPSYQGLEVSVGEASATDEDVDNQLESLRERFGSLVTVERPAAEGDHVVIDLSAHANGEKIEDAQATGLSYQVGTGTMIDGLDEALVGLSAGDSATFETSLLGEHTGEKVLCDVTVTSVKEQELPEVDDEFAQMASEFDTLDELRADLRERVIRLKRLEQAVEARDKALAALLEQTEIPLPEKFIEAQIADHFSGGEHGEEGHRDEVESDVRRSIKTQFILDEIAKREELQVGQDELTQYVIQRAAQSRIDPNAFAQQVVEAGNLPMLLAEVRRAKALALVVEGAKVVDPSGEVIPLERLQEDGTLEEAVLAAEPATES